MLKKLACLLALIASPLFAQMTPQAIPLTSGACKLDGTVGCGGSGGGSGTVTSVAMSGGTTGFSFGGGPITTSGTFTLSGTLAIANGGTNLTTYTLGDILYSSAANTLARLAGNTTTTKKFLMQVGDGVNSAAPSWTATVADFPTFNQNTTGNASTATALAANPADCSAGQYGTAIAANGDLTCAQVAYSQVSGTPAAGATTALDNLASVAINTTLATGAGVAAQFFATAPAQITTAQAGVSNTIAASAAVAGSSVAGAAAGGSVAITAGAAARLTSGNANGGNIILTPGTGIGTGTRGYVSAPGGGTNSTAIGVSSIASGADSTVYGSTASVGGNSYSSAFCYGATVGGFASIAIGRNATIGAHNGSIALGNGATTSSGNQFVVGGPSTGAGNAPITSVYVGSGVTDSTANSVTWNGTGGSGSDNAGASVTWVPGIATGTAASGSWVVKTGVPRATGSTAQGTIVRELIRAKPTTLTESTATAVVTIPVATGKVIGGRLLYTVSATDGTDFQATSGEVLYAAVDKGGTVTVTITQSAETSAASAGTLTSTWTGVANGTNIDLKCNAVSSLTQTVLEVHGQIRNNGDDITGTLTWN